MSHSVHYVSQLTIKKDLPEQVLDILKILTSTDDNVELPDRHILPAHVFFDHANWHTTLTQRRGDWPADFDRHWPKLEEVVALDAEETPIYAIFAAGSPKDGWTRLPLFLDWITPYIHDASPTSLEPIMVLQDDVEPSYFEGIVKAYYMENGKLVSFDRKWGQLTVDETHSHEDPTYME